jgi:hypothetical protein
MSDFGGKTDIDRSRSASELSQLRLVCSSSRVLVATSEINDE